MRLRLRRAAADRAGGVDHARGRPAHARLRTEDGVLRASPAAGGAITDLISGLDDAGWARTGVYNYPETSVRDVAWIVRHTLHELTHHLMDDDRGIGANG